MALFAPHGGGGSHPKGAWGMGTQEKLDMPPAYRALVPSRRAFGAATSPLQGEVFGEELRPRPLTCLWLV